MPSSPQLSEPLDEGALARLRELDPTGANQLLQRVIHAYFGSLERFLPELAAARNPLDFNALRQIAHTLKSSSASLGALILSGHCARLEIMARDQLAEGMDTEIETVLAELERVRAALTMLLPAKP